MPVYNSVLPRADKIRSIVLGSMNLKRVTFSRKKSRGTYYKAYPDSRSSEVPFYQIFLPSILLESSDIRLDIELFLRFIIFWLS